MGKESRPRRRQGVLTDAPGAETQTPSVKGVVRLNIEAEDIRAYIKAHKGKPPNLAPYSLVYSCRWY